MIVRMESLTQWIRKAGLKLAEGKLKVDRIALCKYTRGEKGCVRVNE